MRVRLGGKAMMVLSGCGYESDSEIANSQAA
jgi:hypothetical protein